jgi:hypothetical protein
MPGIHAPGAQPTCTRRSTCAMKWSAPNCGEVIVVSRFARRKTHIPITFGQREVDKQTRELLSERGWTDDQINSAWKSCPSSIVSD